MDMLIGILGWAHYGFTQIPEMLLYSVAGLAAFIFAMWVFEQL